MQNLPKGIGHGNPANKPQKYTVNKKPFRVYGLYLTLLKTYLFLFKI